jgi:hypothetical protein
MALIYFFVRLPAGTYETELVTKVFDAMSLVLFTIALLEGTVKELGRVSIPHLGFFWGMVMMIVALILLFNQPETWITMLITLVATGVGVAALVIDRSTAEPSA